MDNLWECPHCGKSHYRDGLASTTSAYYQPEFKDGVNINPDRNTTTFQRTCVPCGTSTTITLGGVGVNRPVEEQR